MTDCLTVTTTWPDEVHASTAAERLVAEGLAACAQVQGPVHSTFRWEGALERATEWHCVLKSTAARYPALEARVKELHPYEVPEIVATPIMHGNPAYLAWVREMVA